MKFIVRKDRAEGETYPQNAFISYGNSYLPFHVSDCDTLSEWEKVEGTNKKDGWYVKIEIPFTRNMLHLNPDSFDHEERPCRYVLLFRYRPASKRRPNSIRYWHRGWFPL